MLKHFVLKLIKLQKARLKMSSKLCYTWYPKDWGSSDSVFELNLAERGLYRELIDFAMLNDNKTEVKKEVWCRKFSIAIEELEAILNKLVQLKLIEFKSDFLFIESCERRLNLVRGGRKGGVKSKPTSKPLLKPIESLDESLYEAYSEAKEKKRKESKINEKEIKEFSKNEIFGFEVLKSETWIENVSMQNKIQPKEVSVWIEKFNLKLNSELDVKISKKEYASHFVRWLPQEIAKLKKEEIKVVQMQNHDAWQEKASRPTNMI